MVFDPLIESSGAGARASEVAGYRGGGVNPHLRRMT